MKGRTAEGVGPTLEELLTFAKTASLTEVVWQEGERKIAFKRGVAPEPEVLAEESESVAESPVEKKPSVVKSPMVGTFLRGPKGRPPLVNEGDAVSPGQKMGVVEAMQVPKDVVCAVKGRLLKALVESGRSVEYGQPLFEVEELGADRV